MKLYDFFMNDTLGSIYQFFGPPEHATSLFIYKTTDFIRVTHINTGEGFNSNNDMIVHNNKDYYDIFNTLYLPRDGKLIHAFMNYIINKK